MVRAKNIFGNLKQCPFESIMSLGLNDKLNDRNVITIYDDDGKEKKLSTIPVIL